MKGTHPQPRSPRRTAFRTGRRAGRRVIMWAALAMAIGIGVVWAGGERTLFHATIGETYIGGVGVNAYGVRGGVLLTQDEIVDYFQPAAPGPHRWQRREPSMWLPSWQDEPIGGWRLRVPYWIPTLLCLTTFALLFRVERREKQLARAGHCVCGYSLAGLADGAVCPECGVERASLPSGQRSGRS